MEKHEAEANARLEAKKLARANRSRAWAVEGRDTWIVLTRPPLLRYGHVFTYDEDGAERVA